MKPNENFNLNTKELELVEQALLLLQTTSDTRKKRDIQDLRAKFYHQKVWYRPKTTYVSG